MHIETEYISPQNVAHLLKNINKGIFSVSLSSLIPNNCRVQMVYGTSILPLQVMGQPSTPASLRTPKTLLYHIPHPPLSPLKICPRLFQGTNSYDSKFILCQLQENIRIPTWTPFVTRLQDGITTCVLIKKNTHTLSLTTESETQS